MKLSGIFNRAKDLAYFLVENRCMRSPFKLFFQHPRLKVIWPNTNKKWQGFSFKKRDFEKLYDYFFCRYSCSVVRLVID